jgi:hypothetical protein
MGWFLLFIWSVLFVWLNQTDQIDQMNQTNPHPSRLSRATILRAGIIFPKPARSVLRESDAVFPAPESVPH